MRTYRTVYVSHGRIRNPDLYTTQGFTDSLNGAIRATAAKLAISMYPAAMIVNRRTNKIVVTLSNTQIGIHIVRHEDK